MRASLAKARAAYDAALAGAAGDTARWEVEAARWKQGERRRDLSDDEVR